MPLGDFVALMERAGERRLMGVTFPALNAEESFQSTGAA
jgi:hypothetical protein